MSILKTGHGFEANFTLTMSGQHLVLSFRGHEQARFKLDLFGAAAAEYQVYLGVADGKTFEVSDDDGVLEKDSKGKNPVVTKSEIVKFIQCYQSLQIKYTGRKGVYPEPQPNSKKSVVTNWSHFAKAVAQCKQAGLLPHEYLEMLAVHYSRRVSRSGSQASLPFPNQLQGQWAQQVIIEESARRNATEIPAAVRASRLAGTNARIKLEEDQAYNEARARVKTKTCTEFDIEYIKARLTQLYGQPKQWILDAEKELQARIVKAPKGKAVKEDISNG